MTLQVCRVQKKQKKRRKPLEPDQVKLAAENMKLAYNLANKHVAERACRRLYREDAEQTACEALIHAAAGYKPEMGWTFATYATPAIKRALWSLSRREAERRGRCRLSDNMTYHEAPATPDEAERVALDEKRRAFDDFLGSLPLREKSLIELLLYQRLSLSEAAGELSPPTTKETARQTLARALRRLQGWTLYHSILMAVTEA